MLPRHVNIDRCKKQDLSCSDVVTRFLWGTTIIIVLFLCFILFAVEQNFVEDKRRMERLDGHVLIQKTVPVVMETATRPFPRWGDTVEEEAQSGIALEPVLDFILNSSIATYISQQSLTSLKDVRYIPTSDHKDDVGYWLPETLYVLDHNGLSSSLRHRMCNAYGRGTIKDKVVPTERIIMSAIDYLKNDTETTCIKWPKLCNTLIGNKNDPTWSASSGVPFLIYYGDYTGCNHNNYKRNMSVPLFSPAAAVDCNHAIPFVTHELLEMTYEKESDWDTYFHRIKKLYPWESKRPQIVWRGALTGKYVNETYRNKRWNMIHKIHSVKRKFLELGYKEETFIFDTGAVRFPIRPESKHWTNDIDKELGGLVKKVEMEDFQKYRAILDIDGHSWSSRFNLLLCYNSVTIKIEPTWVDYLQYSKRNENGGISHLEPWKHYIPVKADLSDLFEVAAFVNDPSNDQILHGIIQNANAWCRQSLVRHSIELDILNILERYVDLIDIGNPNWRVEQWKSAKQTIMDTDSTLRMKLLTMEEDIYYGQDEVRAYKKQYGIPIKT